MIPVHMGEMIFDLLLEDVEIISEDIPGWQVVNQGRLTVALDITISPEMKEKGLAREIVNRIQNIRKDKGFEVTDKINVIIEGPEEVILSVKNNFDYIRSEILANSLEIVNQINSEEAVSVEVDDNLSIKTIVNKYSNGE
jgi:isoleucyl-tRNA synthetase